MALADSTLRTARRFAWDLAQIQDADELAQVTLHRLRDVLHGECSGLNAISLSTNEAQVVLDTGPLTADLADAMAAHVDDHPMVTHYARAGADARPVRVSDLVDDRRWRDTGVYADVFAPLGTDRQLALMVHTGTPSGVVGYAVNRSGADFDDNDLELAEVLQPVLVALDRSTYRNPVPALSTGTHRQGARVRLTRREVDVLALVAAGLTAQSVARRLAISPHTVLRHLEHAYRKLDANDRITAVNRARAWGLLEPVKEPPNQSE